MGCACSGPRVGSEPPPDLSDVLPPDGALLDPTPRFTTVGAVGGGPSFRVLVEGVPNGGAIAVAQSLRATEHTYRQIVTVEVAAALAVLLTLCMAAWWLLRHGVRPIEQMAVTANAIADGDLSRRVAPAEEKTEVGKLGIALNTMLGQIEGAFEERQESENRLRRFVADASHELRTPLTSIRGYAELWRAGAIETPDEQADAMRRVEHEASRMGRLVDDMLLLARLDEGRPLDLDDVDLGHIAEDATRDARAVEPERPITLSTEDGVVVSGDADRLRQVTANLVANALVHTPPGTQVEVRVRRDGPAAVLEVTDHGPGLSPELRGQGLRALRPGRPCADPCDRWFGSRARDRRCGGRSSWRTRERSTRPPVRVRHSVSCSPRRRLTCPQQPPITLSGDPKSELRQCSRE